jgi:hypothetical protein
VPPRNLPTVTGPRLLAALAALTALTLPSAASAADLMIKVRERHISELGGFRTSGMHGTLGEAIRAWGRPSSRKRVGNTGCRVGWSSVGVRATFANFGGGSGCSERLARLQTAKLRSKRWTTERGLHVGDPSAKLKQLHPEAKFAASYFLLYTAPDRYGNTGLDLPVVAAQMKGGAVRQYLVEVLAAGD